MIGNKAVSLRMIMHYIGRIAFPLFAFLITEGFTHTHDRKKYGINLLTFALISELPWNLVHTGELFYSRQNVFFTLLLGYMGLCAIDLYKNDHKKLIITLACLLGVSLVLRADYTCFGFGFILLLYILKDRYMMAILGCCMLPSRWIGGLAFIPILMYNGQRGFAKAKWTKYAFYIFYPLHLLALYLIRTYILM